MQAARHFSRGNLASVVVSALLCACASAPPPEPAAAKPAEPAQEPAAADEPLPPEKEPVETGKDCATAEAECDGGLCKVAVKNDCPEPVTCDLAIAATCRAGTNMVEAKARTRDTVAAQKTGEVGVVANCTMGEVVHTEVKEFRCQ